MSMPPIGYLNGADASAVAATTSLLAASVPAGCAGLVPYHADGYARYLSAAVAPSPPLRTVSVRVVEEDGVPVAAADWRHLPDELFLNGLAVRADRRGKGLGAALLADGRALARSHGLRALGLDVATDNAPALALYRRFDFVARERTRWWELPEPAGADGPDVAVLDWPAFAAHRAAYGFGDLTIRDHRGGTHRIRAIGTAMRVPDAGLAGHTRAALAAALGARRHFTTCDAVAGAAPLGHFARMRAAVPAG